MSEHLIERLEQWPSCPAGADPFASTYVGPLMKEAAAEINRLREALANLDGADVNDWSTMHPDLARQRAREALSPTPTDTAA